MFFFRHTTTISLHCPNKMCFFLTRAIFCLARSFLLEKILTQTIQFILNGLILFPLCSFSDRVIIICFSGILFLQCRCVVMRLSLNQNVPDKEVTSSRLFSFIGNNASFSPILDESPCICISQCFRQAFI